MAKCSKCGKSVSDDVKFCPDCGGKILITKTEGDNKFKSIFVIQFILNIFLLSLTFISYFGDMMVNSGTIESSGWWTFQLLMFIQIPILMMVVNLGFLIFYSIKSSNMHTKIFSGLSIITFLVNLGHAMLINDVIPFIGMITAILVLVYGITILSKK